MLDRMLAVISDPTPGQEDEYNAWYDSVHIPEALGIPGFRAARRFRMIDRPEDPGHTLGASYLTLYELDSDPETAMANLRKARKEDRLSPLSPAVDAESIRRVTFEAASEWANDEGQRDRASD